MFIKVTAYLTLIREYRCFFMQIGEKSLGKSFKVVMNTSVYERILQLLIKPFYFRQLKVHTLIKNAHLPVTSVSVVVF